MAAIDEDVVWPGETKVEETHVTETRLVREIPIRFEYDGFETDGHKEHIQSIISQYAFLFPHWVRHVSVELHTEQGNAEAWSQGHHEYGDVELCVTFIWLNKPLRRQHQMIIHELLHLAHLPVFSYARGTVMGLLEEKEDLHSILHDEFTERVETYIVHMTEVILNAHWE